MTVVVEVPLADAIVPEQISQADLTRGKYGNFDCDDLGRFPPYYYAISLEDAVDSVVAAPVMTVSVVVSYLLWLKGLLFRMLL